MKKVNSLSSTNTPLATYNPFSIPSAKIPSTPFPKYTVKSVAKDIYRNLSQPPTLKTTDFFEIAAVINIRKNIELKLI